MTLTSVSIFSICISAETICAGVSDAHTSLKNSVNEISDIWKGLGLTDLVPIAEQLSHSVQAFRPKEAHTWDAEIFECTGCNHQAQLASIIDMGVKVSLCQGFERGTTLLLPRIQTLVRAVGWQRLARDPTCSGHTTLYDPSTVGGTISLDRIDKLISTMSIPGSEGAQESGSFDDCQKLLKSFIESSIPYLSYDPDNPEEQSVALGRVCFAATLMKEQINNHPHYPGGGRFTHWP